jgi:hypothetical protein
LGKKNEISQKKNTAGVMWRFFVKRICFLPLISWNHFLFGINKNKNKTKNDGLSVT